MGPVRVGALFARVSDYPFATAFWPMNREPTSFVGFPSGCTVVAAMSGDAKLLILEEELG